MDETEAGAAVRHPARDFTWSGATLVVTLMACPGCGQPIYHHTRQDTGERWYFHGNSAQSPSLVLSEVEARQAAQSTVRARTVPGRVRAFCEQLHKWPGDKRLEACRRRLTAAGVLR
jgi:hypothetical protein